MPCKTVEFSIRNLTLGCLVLIQLEYSVLVYKNG